MASTMNSGPQNPKPRSNIGTFFVGIWQVIAKPHPSVTDLLARRQARLMMALSLVLMFTNSAAVFVTPSASGDRLSQIVLIMLVTACLLSYILGRTPWFAIGSLLLTVSLAASGFGLVLAGSDDPSISLYTTIPYALVIASILFPLWGLFAISLSVFLLTIALPFVATSVIPVDAFRDSGLFLIIGILLVVATMFRNAVERERLRELATANAELTNVRTSLEERVVSRTADLARRTAYLAASAEVSQVIMSILDTERLIEQVVDLIRKQFDLYYVGLFLVDSSREWAELHAGTGQAGQAMLARHHRLPIGPGSMIGWCIANVQARVALEAEQDAQRLATSELPDTRSEAALPLRSRGQILGALTVQSDQSGVFDENTMAVLQTMADQVAVALDNARLFVESQSALESVQRAYGQASEQAWVDLLSAESDKGFRSQGQQISAIKGAWPPEMIQAVQTGSLVVKRDDVSVAAESELITPLKVGDQLIGALAVSTDRVGGQWTDQEMALFEALGEQIGVALERARLYQNTQDTAIRERLVSQAAGRIRESLDLETMLRTAAIEIQQALNLGDVMIRLASPEGETGERA